MAISGRKDRSGVPVSETRRLYSLAYGRALKALALRHPEEFKLLLAELKREVYLERQVFGEVFTQEGGGMLGGSPPKHVPGSDGRCAECGEESPCRLQRRRITDQKRRARQREEKKDE